jgi:hypothetical protein
MENVRVIGLIFGAGLVFYTMTNRRNRSRGELLLTLAIAVSSILLSIDPASANFLAGLFSLRNRLFAVLVLSNIVLFVLFLFMLKQSDDMKRDLSHVVRMIAQTEYQRQHDRTEGNHRAMIIIPAYKEEEIIADVLDQIPESLLGYQIEPVVVVDGNYDNTERVVRSKGHRVATHVANRGQGSALITGFEIALRERADIVITMDADGQHQVDDLPALLQPILNNEADYVMGSRFAGEYEDRGGARHLGIVVFSYMISLLAGTRITDCTNGYRAIRTDKLVAMALFEERFNAPELIIQAARRGLRIKEVPVTIHTRAAGESKKPRRLGYPLKFGAAMLRAWLR